MKTFRQIFFWAHLVSGLIASISIFIMCFTGAAIAFEGELVAWSERDVRRVTPPADGAARLPLEELQKRVREINPEARPSGIVVSADPRAAVAFTLGRDGAFYANPYTGEVKQAATPNKVHDFLHLMEDWHRVLAMGGDNRPTGKAINGACNLAFCFLALSGLYLWWPRTWSWRGFKAIAFLNFSFKGKARDFNWHNSIGLWSAPILVVLTLTAVPISYRWGGNLIYKLTGEQPPVQQGPGAGAPAAPAVEIPRPPEGTRPLGYEALLTAVRQTIPDAELITFRTGAGGAGRGAPRVAGAAAAGSTPPAQADGQARPEGERRAPAQGEARREGGRGGEGRPAAAAVSVTVKQPGSWPRTATTTLTLNPYTGDVLKTEGYADLSAARQIRSWTRFLHTGQALGWGGQFIAGLACLGGCFLVYTGIALAWRRFFFKKTPAPAANTGA
jgi:uncharacterized iron-regulated membrane protein